ncbi:MAG TPA: hypothetical protein VHO70_10165 [Chitinispirillaceae bacterium]|nr:hypothetical protein [Chitinispirillaceae bacterium]
MAIVSKLKTVIFSQSVKHIFWSVFTQGMLSVASFVLSFVIAVKASKEEYGLYILLFNIIGIFGNYQNAVINTPLTILLRKQQDEKKFIGSFAFGQWLLIVPLILACIGASAV